MNTYKRKSPKNMEPMSSGRAGGNPNANTFLPSFLLGESNTETMTFKGNRRGSKTLFSGYQDVEENQSADSVRSSKCCKTNDGPPIIGLFDMLRQEQYQVLTPLHPPTPTTRGQLDYNLPGNSNQTLSGQQNTLHINPFVVNKSSATIKSESLPETLFFGLQNIQYVPPPTYTEFWVTVYGFEQHLFRLILQHFATCGAIVHHVLAPHNGNWVDIKYATQLACDNALSYTELILFNSIMIGVKQCQDEYDSGEENINKLMVNSEEQTGSILPRDVINDEKPCSSHNNKDSNTSVLMRKAIDLLFSW